jgi:hypothetical protein
MRSAILSLSVICSVFGTALCKGETQGNVGTYAVIESDIPMNNERKQPTHIIKWKNGSVNKLTGKILKLKI